MQRNTQAESRANIDASIERIGLVPTVNKICWDAIGRCAASLQRPMSLREVAAFYAETWRVVVDDDPSTAAEQAARFTALLQASLEWKDPRGLGERVH